MRHSSVLERNMFYEIASTAAYVSVGIVFALGVGVYGLCTLAKEKIEKIHSRKPTYLSPAHSSYSNSLIVEPPKFSSKLEKIL